MPGTAYGNFHVKQIHHILRGTTLTADRISAETQAAHGQPYPSAMYVFLHAHESPTHGPAVDRSQLTRQTAVQRSADKTEHWLWRLHIDGYTTEWRQRNRQPWYEAKSRTTISQESDTGTGSILLDGLAILTALVLLWRSNRKRAAVGRRFVAKNPHSAAQR